MINLSYIFFLYWVGLVFVYCFWFWWYISMYIIHKPKYMYIYLYVFGLFVFNGCCYIFFYFGCVLLAAKHIQCITGDLKCILFHFRWKLVFFHVFYWLSRIEFISYNFENNNCWLGNNEFLSELTHNLWFCYVQV